MTPIKCDLDIEINKISKIEGHADLDIRVRDGQVEEVHLKVMENMRFFNQAVQGMAYNQVPQLVSRICGTCSIAHLTACIEAVEKTLEIKPSLQTMVLRKLTVYSMMIRDHALHLYFFVLPDIYKIDSILELGDDKRYLIEAALAVKEAGNNLSNLIAGRAVHAPFEQVGGFSHQPDESKIPAMIAELRNVRQKVIGLADIMYDCDWKLEREMDFSAIVTDDFSFLEGRIKTHGGLVIEERDYWYHLQNVVLPYSQASGFKMEGHTFLVGALARLNLNNAQLHPDTKRDMAKHIARFPSKNVFDNNLAQAIEILHSIDHSIELLENTKFVKEDVAPPKKLTGEGVGVIEAPRGTLYYWLGITDGKVRYANLVIPTAQNLVAMKDDVRRIVEEALAKQCSLEEYEKEIRFQVEKLIRAYDPCMSCASHFLRINWK